VLDSDHRGQIALEAVKLWHGEPASLQHISDSENHVYNFTIAEKKLFLRLTSSEHRILEEIEAELDFVSYLGRGGVSVSLPLTSASGRAVETVHCASQSFFACAFEEAEGERFTFGSSEENEKHFHLRGQTLGRIHALAKKYAPSTTSRRFAWDEDDCVLNAERYLPQSEDVVWSEYHQLMGWLRELPKDKQSFGLIHGDFGATNYRYKADCLTVFDFDDCCYHWFTYDLAIVIYPHGWRTEAKALIEWLLEGYSKEVTWSVPIRDGLTHFCRLRLLYMFLSYAKKWGFTGLSEQQARWFGQKRENIARGYKLSGV
jgi:Ser/Thr protein kinase RdoA (MazF antagonist)